MNEQLAMQETPRYEHDCDKCVFLGCHDEYDLYWCGQGLSYRLPTVIARFSSDGPDYISGVCFADSGSVPQLVEAKKRAIAIGLRCERMNPEETKKTVSD